MILTYEQLAELIGPFYEDIETADMVIIMKEVERLTREETRDAICNKLDDFLHPFIYGDKG
jgi:hypothetical protein